MGALTTRPRIHVFTPIIARVWCNSEGFISWVPQDMDVGPSGLSVGLTGLPQFQQAKASVKIPNHVYVLQQIGSCLHKVVLTTHVLSQECHTIWSGRPTNCWCLTLHTTGSFIPALISDKRCVWHWKGCRYVAKVYVYLFQSGWMMGSVMLSFITSYFLEPDVTFLVSHKSLLLFSRDEMTM